MTNGDGGAAHDEEPANDNDGAWRQVAQRHFDPEQDPDLTTTLVYAISDAKDVPPKELKSKPLYEVVDATAIQDTFFGLDGIQESRQSAGSVEFRYLDLLVTVGSDGWIQVHERADTNLQ